MTTLYGKLGDLDLSKREQSFKRKVAKVEEIVERLSKEYPNLPQRERMRLSLPSRISATVQLELSMSLRKAQEYIKLVKMKQKLFWDHKIHTQTHTLFFYTTPFILYNILLPPLFESWTERKML